MPQPERYDPGLPLERWYSYRCGLIATRIGALTSAMYRERFGLSQPDWRSLAVIARWEKLSAKELAGRTSSDPFKVARAIDHLLTRGLITRDPDPADRRRVHLRLTAEGWRIYREVERYSQQVERAIRTTLGPEEVAAFERTLDVLDERIAALVAAAAEE